MLKRSKEETSSELMRAGWAQEERPVSSAAGPKKSQVERCKHQDEADVYDQPFSKMGSEEREIFADNGGNHHRNVKYDSYLSTHLHYPSAKPRIGSCTAIIRKPFVQMCCTVAPWFTSR
jgi:hypothetical protein